MINYQVGLGYDTLHEDEVHARSQIDMTGTTVFNIYFGILVLLKLVKAFDAYKMEKGVITQVFPNGIDDVITFSTVSVVFVYLIINFAWIYSTDSELLNPHNIAKDGSKFPDFNAERAIWLSKFVVWA